MLFKGILRENLKHEKQINMPVPIRASVFGVPLEELMGFDGEKGSAPRVVKDAIQYIRESGASFFDSSASRAETP